MSAPILSDLTALFIDDGGVMNDNVSRGAEWRRLVGEFFAPALGGDRSAWTDANRVVFGRLEPLLIAGPAGRDYTSWFEAYQLRWLRDMAAFVGVAAPVDDSQCLKLAWEASDYITERVHSACPGAAEAIRVLQAEGYTLFTASGEHSRELDGYMKGMGIRECFRTLYGCDLIDQGKYSIEYYRRLFDHAGIPPNRALVVDDRPQYLSWATSLGAATCLVSSDLWASVQATLTVSGLAELPLSLNG